MKNLLNLGEVLNKTEQQSINGGGFAKKRYKCNNGIVCPPSLPCCTIDYICISGPIGNHCR